MGFYLMGWQELSLPDTQTLNHELRQLEIYFLQGATKNGLVSKPIQVLCILTNIFDRCTYQGVRNVFH